MNELFNSQEVQISDSEVTLKGKIFFKEMVKSWIIFANGNSNSHQNIRDISFAKTLAKASFGVLLLDQLTNDENISLENRFNIQLISERLMKATQWLMKSSNFKAETPIAFFGSQTGAAAALETTTLFTGKNPIYSIVLKSARTDLLEEKILTKIYAPTLLLVASEDLETIQINKIATQFLLNGRLTIIAHSNPLFEGPGNIEEVERLTLSWFEDHLPTTREYFQQF